MLIVLKMTDPKTLGPRAEKAMKDLLEELKSLCESIEETQVKLPDDCVYGDLAYYLEFSIEKTVLPLVEELQCVNSEIMNYEYEKTMRSLPR